MMRAISDGVVIVCDVCGSIICYKPYAVFEDYIDCDLDTYRFVCKQCYDKLVKENNNEV